jgi:hypothetical protein
LQIPQSESRHGDGGSLGVDINSHQPAAVAPAALHLSQVPENMRSVGNEPPVEPLHPIPVDMKPSKLVYEPEAQMFVPDNSSSASSASSGNEMPETHTTSSQPNNEGLLNQVVHKAEGIFVEVKDLAGTAFEEIREKATGVWHSVAGTIGAGPGKELGEDHSERLVAGKDRELHRDNSGEDVSETNALMHLLID